MQTNEQKLAVLRYMYMSKVLRNVLISSGKAMLVDCSQRHDDPNTYVYYMIIIDTPFKSQHSS
jgi:hypothetical protein